MNYSELSHLIQTALNRTCGCKSKIPNATQCAQDWCTWRRFNKSGDLSTRNASCFAGHDNSDTYSQVLNVNVRDPKTAQGFILTGQGLGFQTSTDQGDGNTKRVWVDTQGLSQNTLTGNQYNFLIRLIRSASGAF